MRTLAVLPIKSLTAAKQRLGDLLGNGSRRALAQAMCSDVLTSLRRVERIDAIAVVSRDPSVQSVAIGERISILDDSAEAGQSAAAQIGVRHALTAGFDRVLLVPGDTPLLDPLEVDELLRRGEQSALQTVIVPDRHGEGTNALLLCPPDVFEPSFGPGSLARHTAAARAAGLAYAVEHVDSLALDVDTPDDFAELGASLTGRHGRAPLTRGALRQLQMSHAPSRTSDTERPAAALRG